MQSSAKLTYYNPIPNKKKPSKAPPPPPSQSPTTSLFQILPYKIKKKFTLTNGSPPIQICRYSTSSSPLDYT